MFSYKNLETSSSCCYPSHASETAYVVKITCTELVEEQESEMMLAEQFHVWSLSQPKLVMESLNMISGKVCKRDVLFL